MKKEDIYDEKINNENRINYLFREVKPINAVYINLISMSINKHKSDFSFFDFEHFLCHSLLLFFRSRHFFFFLSSPHQHFFIFCSNSSSFDLSDMCSEMFIKTNVSTSVIFLFGVQVNSNDTSSHTNTNSSKHRLFFAEKCLFQ